MIFIINIKVIQNLLQLIIYIYLILKINFYFTHLNSNLQFHLLKNYQNH
jgi:hypothetical protein